MLHLSISELSVRKCASKMKTEMINEDILRIKFEACKGYVMLVYFGYAGCQVKPFCTINTAIQEVGRQTNNS